MQGSQQEIMMAKTRLMAGRDEEEEMQYKSGMTKENSTGPGDSLAWGSKRRKAGRDYL